MGRGPLFHYIYVIFFNSPPATSLWQCVRWSVTGRGGEINKKQAKQHVCDVVSDTVGGGAAR